MNTLYYQAPGYWVGDCMPFGEGDTFYIFHQRDDRDPEPLGKPFGWSLVTTKDFIHYEDHGVVIPHGGERDQDQFIYAGSVCKVDDRYHIIYTGYNRNIENEGGLSQVPMHAVSSDLYHWRKVDEPLPFLPQDGYDPSDWRDPWVVRDDEQDRYLVLLGARQPGPKTRRTGRTVCFSSPDFMNWKFEGDFWAPGLYTMHEMPDLFKMGDWWYHIVTEYSDRHGMTYRMSRSLNGPWLQPPDDGLEGSAYYAARTFALNGHRILFGWVGTKEGDQDTGNYEWGGAFVPHEIFQRPDHTLGVKPVTTLWDGFIDRKRIDDFVMQGNDGRVQSRIADHLGSPFAFEADVRFASSTRSFGLVLEEDPETEAGYQFLCKVDENRCTFEGSPNFPWFNTMNIGLTRPVRLDAGSTHHLQVVVDDTIATLYIDGVALSTRMYRSSGGSVGMFVTDGSLKLSNAWISNTVRR